MNALSCCGLHETGKDAVGFQSKGRKGVRKERGHRKERGQVLFFDILEFTPLLINLLTVE
jgi:hypothetical protein